MIDDIINTVKDQIGVDLMEKFGLDAGQKDKALDITKETISNTVSKESMGGGLSGVMNLFSSNDNDDDGNSMLESIRMRLALSSQINWV